jgi:hypothetical protein
MSEGVHYFEFYYIFIVFFLMPGVKGLVSSPYPTPHPSVCINRNDDISKVIGSRACPGDKKLFTSFDHYITTVGML